MQKVVSVINFGDVKKGDCLAVFQISGLAKKHYWVEKGWAEVVG